MKENTRTSAFGGLYLLFLFIRFLGIFGTGCVHPDQYYQSLEISARDILGFQITVPWEFEPDHALRSSLIPAILGYIPHFLGRIFLNNDLISKFSALHYLPKIWYFLLSLFQDWVFFKIASIIKPHDASKALFLFASSVSVLGFFLMGLANNLEMLCFACALYFYLKSKFVPFAIISVIGIWIRFTFIALVAPFVFYSLFIKRKIVAITLAGILTSITLLLIDSYYYGRFVIPPLNALLFNASTENVAQFGLSPRYTHLLIHGPLILSVPFAFLFTKRVGLLNLSALLYFACLSASPHQEPRFLIPLTLHLSLLATDLCKRKFLLIVYITQCLIISSYITYLENARVLHSLEYLSLQPNIDHTFYFHTFMAPRSFLNPSHSSLKSYFYNVPMEALLVDTSVCQSTCCKIVTPWNLGFDFKNFTIEKNFYPNYDFFTFFNFTSINIYSSYLC